MGKIILADNMDVLPELQSDSIDLIYIDPPFNTGKTQKRTQLKTVRDEDNGDRVGFGGKKYRTVKLGSRAFDDRAPELQGWRGRGPTAGIRGDGPVSSRLQI